jgi:hypothetical protein
MHLTHDAFLEDFEPIRNNLNASGAPPAETSSQAQLLPKLAVSTLAVPMTPPPWANTSNKSLKRQLDSVSPATVGGLSLLMVP